MLNLGSGVNGMSPEKTKEINLYGKVKDMRPAARDGHTGCIIGDKFIVFGGDRHQMPHNDLHFLDID